MSPEVAASPKAPGSYEESQWEALLGDFNEHAERYLNANIARLEQMAKTICEVHTNKKNAVRDVLAKYSWRPCCEFDQEQELLKALLHKYGHGTGFINSASDLDLSS